MKKRFGENCCFIRCDRFPATLVHFLSRLSKVTGADVENPQDLTPLFPFLSSKEMLIVLDNAELILDLRGANSQEIYALVEELCYLGTISLCTTSWISTIALECTALEVPNLSIEAAYDAFCRIQTQNQFEQLDILDHILDKLDFHPLSVTLLATVALQSRWDAKRLLNEWEEHRRGTLQVEHQTSLDSTIEFSLTSPLFREFGLDARWLLEVVVFYPQGVNEKDVNWLFPTIPDATRILNQLCTLSLAHRSNWFNTTLAPLRDHFRPVDPNLSLLLQTTKECFFARMSVRLYSNQPGFRDTG